MDEFKADTDKGKMSVCAVDGDKGHLIDILPHLDSAETATSAPGPAKAGEAPWRRRGHAFNAMRTARATPMRRGRTTPSRS